MYTFNKIRLALVAVFVAAFTACISNDLPYPWVLPSVESVDIQSVDEQGNELLLSEPVIDSVSRSIALELSEWADIENVVINGLVLSEGTTCVNPEIFATPFDLTSPVEVELQRYERVFTWTISATQQIERYFNISSQIGTAIIDVESHTVKAQIPEKRPLTEVQVKNIKLGGLGAVMTPDLNNQTADFSNPLEVTVTEHGRDTKWTIIVEQTEVSVELLNVDAWTNVAWLYGSAEVGKDNGFEYRLAGSDEWVKVPAEWITHEGGSFTGRLIHLEAETTYEARAYSDNDYGFEVLEFTTGAAPQLPNSNLQDWWKDGKVWNPWKEGGTSFWSSGNRGAVTLGESNTMPIENTSSPTGFAGASLNTKFVGISILGKLAAGNLFSGDFVRIDGTNGVLALGREFNARPKKLKVRLKYTTAPITEIGKDTPDGIVKGQNDIGIVWCALADWNEQFEIRTNPANRKLFSRDDAGVIAYGEFTSDQTIEDYIDVEIPLEYVATNREPKYIVITAAASKYGDYFTGGRGAMLNVLSYELLYDY